jgi:hypothetical protein
MWCLHPPGTLVFPAGRPPKRFRKNDDDNVNDLGAFIGRGFSSLKSLTSRNKSGKSSAKRPGSMDVGSDDMSPTAAAAADKLPV